MSEVKGTKALELWCKRLVKDCPDVHIDNMTTSWRNGIAFCALVHHFRPDLIDLSKLNPDNIYENNQLAYNIAEKHLGIPALLDPEDMVENDVPDRLSILTYLSQFYQRLGHTVNTKVSDSDSKVSSTTSTPSSTPIKFGKVALDKCTVCGLPVYLAQRLIVSQKLYHRRCFRCSTCLGHLNPKNFHVIELNKFSCDSCKNDKSMSKYLNNNDQMGMLAFTNDAPETRQDTQQAEPNSSKLKARPQSILEKISMFEKNIEKDSVNKMDENFSNISLKDNYLNKYTDVSTSNYVNDSNVIEPQKVESICTSDSFIETVVSNPGSNNHTPTLPEKVYKTNKDKFNFLQTQLSDDTPDTICIPDVKYNSDFTDIKFTSDTKTISDTKFMADIKFISDKKGISDKKILPDTKFVTNTEYNIPDTKLISDTKFIPDIKFISDTKFIQDTAVESNVTHINDVLLQKEDKVNLDQSENISTKTNENNITDDSRLAQNNLSVTKDSYIEKDVLNDENIKISVPPRRKKQNATKKVLEKSVKETSKPNVEYPVHLNPFSEDEDENEDTEKSRNISTNPFGSSDEEEEIKQKQPSPPKDQSQPVKRLIKACNPFWSDGEEPSSDEETTSRSAYMHKSSLTTSTPNLPGSTPRRRKPKAPAPPPIISEHLDVPSTSMDDVASISSFSSHTSTVHSDQKSCGTYTPKSRKRRPAPTPPDSLSTLSGCAENLDRSIDSPSGRNNSDGVVRRVKGPAPGLPLPERREVKMQMLPEELQVQLDLLETQQLGLERQGVLIEQMIRDKCEGDDGPTAPQEEIEDLVIQLCELVNEKNDLFRKQTELMYIRRQQRLEQEQADIEHEIRVIQSRPAVNRIDADKVREEQLVARLVQVVLLRDELVQQMDAERRRERQEDLAIAASIASKRAQRNSESNSSSMKSADATPVKKNKVKDKVKKQLKKAKHTLISKKKDEDKPEKEKKSK